MTNWPDTSDIRHDFILTYTRNHDSYMTWKSLDSQLKYYGGVFDAWLRKVKADTLRDFAKTLDTYSGTVLNADSAANMARVTANGIEGVSR